MLDRYILKSKEFYFCYNLFMDKDEYLPNKEGHPERRTIDDIFTQELLKSGETSPALELADAYRERLDALIDALNGMPNSEDLYQIARSLDTLQATFRLTYSFTCTRYEKQIFAGVVEESVKVMDDSLVDFPYKAKIVSNSRHRAHVFRNGEENMRLKEDDL